MKNNKVLFCNPVQRYSHQGRNAQVYTIKGKTGELVVSGSMKKNKELGTVEQVSFPYNPDKQRLETGLDEIIDNPFYAADPKEIVSKYNLSNKWETKIVSVSESERISKQTYFEIISGVDPDFYTSEMRYTIFNPPSHGVTYEPTFLQKFKIILYDRPNRFEDDNTPRTSRERLAMQLIKVHPKIANSKQGINSAFHTWYVSEENEAELEYNKKSEIINKATYHLFKIQNEDSDYRMYQVASLLKDKNSFRPIIKGKTTRDLVISKLNDFVTNQKNTSQMRNIDEFMKIVNMLKTQEGSDKFFVKYLIQQAINTNIVSVKDGYYIWHSKFDTPNAYKFSDENKFINFIKKDYETYNPKDKDVQNWYADLKNELIAKNVWLDEL